jgi:hypothetical protein
MMLALLLLATKPLPQVYALHVRWPGQMPLQPQAAQDTPLLEPEETVLLPVQLAGHWLALPLLSWLASQQPVSPGGLESVHVYHHLCAQSPMALPVGQRPHTQNSPFLLRVLQPEGQWLISAQQPFSCGQAPSSQV